MYKLKDPQRKRRRRGIALPFHDLSTYMGVGVQHYVPAGLPPGRDLVPIVQEAG
jgi:hypothetical protein